MDPESPLLHTKHIFRVAFLLLIALVVLLLGRSFFVPETWGEYGNYRGASVDEFRALPVQHEGDDSCRTCHEDEFDEHAEGSHHSVRCELCHAPAALHVKDDEKVADMPVLRSADLCLRCHEYMAARPASFPQIQPRQHVEENDGEPGPDACFDCHAPHSPL